MRTLLAVTGFGLAALLAGCGGGGTTAKPAPTPTPSGPASLIPPGVYTGASSTGQQLQVLSLADGTFWAAASATGQASGTSVLTLARVKASGGNLTSTSASTSALPGTSLPIVDNTQVTGSYAANQISATLTDGASSTYALAYSTAYTGAASLAQIAGAYAGTLKIFIFQANSTFVQPTIAINIDPATGSVSGTIARSGTQLGTVAGTVTPRADVNAYNVTLSFATTDEALGALLSLPCQGYGLYHPADGLQLIARPTSGNPIGFWASGPN